MTLYEQLKAIKSHKFFMEYFWQKKKSEPLKIGLHTKEICHRIDKAIEDFDNGISTYLIITVPFRHGKSDIISRYLPAHFMGTHPDCDVMIATYSANLAQGFSDFSRELTKNEDYQKCFKRTYAKGTADGWKVTGGVGVVTASGITSGITGKGYHLGILDDFCSGREEAESASQRQKAWECFTNDFFTRQAPTSITIILATPWHVDDIIGRIKAKNDPNSDAYDEGFQKFEVVSFPAKNGSVDVWNEDTGEYEHIDYDYLFKERFSAEYYERQFVSLGIYASSALLQCNPQIRGGNYLKTDKIKFHDNVADFPKTKYSRVWDLAHTAKQKLKDDPDYTAGTLLTYKKNKDGQLELWIKHVARFREDTPERDRMIRLITDKDGASVQIAVENSLDSKDAIKTLQQILMGKRVVKALNLKGDKIARISPVEPILEAGNVHVLRGEWNYDWLNEMKEFPSGKHDDMVDNISAGYNLYCSNANTVVQSHFGV